MLDIYRHEADEFLNAREGLGVSSGCRRPILGADPKGPIRAGWTGNLGVVNCTVDLRLGGAVYWLGGDTDGLAGYPWHLSRWHEQGQGHGRSELGGDRKSVV